MQESKQEATKVVCIVKDGRKSLKFIHSYEVSYHMSSIMQPCKNMHWMPLNNDDDDLVFYSP